MMRQRLLRALLIWVVLVMIPVSLIVTDRLPEMRPMVVNVLSVISLVATLALCVYVLTGRGVGRR